MSTLIIEYENDLAENILQSLVGLKVIRILKQNRVEPNVRQKLSERFAGALHLTDRQYDDMQLELDKSRAEWERNIY